MARRRAEGVLHGLGRLAEEQAAQLSDGQLLSRFATDRDEGAFAVLVHRHGPLVFHVCRNNLHSPHDAEDAFQATFLLLARRAGAIRDGEVLASWLARVAYRVSMKARLAAARRRRREDLTARPVEDRPAGDVAWRDLQAILDEELNRLPEKYRVPFVLCVLAGKTKAEAAAELGWKEGTVSSRLARARELLQTRLARRGVTLSAVLSGLVINHNGPATAVPAALVAAVREAVPRFLSGEAMTTAPAALARSVLRGMARARAAVVGAILVVLGLGGIAATIALRRPAEPVAPVAFLPAAGGAPVEVVNPAVDGLRQLEVRGRVVSQDGKGVAGADVAILADEHRPSGDRDFGVSTRRRVVATGKSDAEGRFRFVTARPVIRLVENLYCLARGEGQAVNWQQVRDLVTDPLELKLESGQKLRGRLADAEGKPAAGVTLRFGGFRRLPDWLPTLVEEVATPAWPAPIVTDADGRFVLEGVVRRTTVHFRVQDERYGPHWLAVTANNSDETDAGTIRLKAPRVLEGTVVAGGTPAPLADATVVIESHNDNVSGVVGRVIVRTDATGRFKAQVYPGPSLAVTAAGAPGTPDLAASQNFEWPADASRHQLELRVPRGVLLRGRVVEQDSGLPVVGARVQYIPVSSRNPAGIRGNLLILWPWLDAASDANGLFELPVAPGPGQLLVRGPGHDWVPREVGYQEITARKQGGDRPHFPDAFVPLDLKADEEPAPVVATLRRGVTLQGHVVTADGKPVASGFLISRTYLGRGWESHSESLPVRDGRFEIPGCDPAGTEPYWFLDHKAGQGAMVRLSARDQGTTVRLAPYGSASVRFVDATGAAVPRLPVRLQLVIRPGPVRGEPAAKDTPWRLTLDANFQGVDVDAATGVVTAKSLIPGATYVFDSGRGGGTQPFSVTPEQKVRLPDVVVASPAKGKQP